MAVSGTLVVALVVTGGLTAWLLGQAMSDWLKKAEGGRGGE